MEKEGGGTGSSENTEEASAKSLNAATGGGGVDGAGRFRGAVAGLSWNPNGQQMYSVDKDKTIVIWEAE